MSKKQRELSKNIGFLYVRKLFTGWQSSRERKNMRVFLLFLVVALVAGSSYILSQDAEQDLCNEGLVQIVKSSDNVVEKSCVTSNMVGSFKKLGWQVVTLDSEENVPVNVDVESEPIPAYLVASSIMPEGYGSLDAYGEATHPLMEKYGGELLVGGAPDQEMNHFEGEWPNQDARFTLFKFPSMKHLLDFWNSEEYQSVKHLRTDTVAPNFTFAVEGYDSSSYEYGD